MHRFRAESQNRMPSPERTVRFAEVFRSKYLRTLVEPLQDMPKQPGGPMPMSRLPRATPRKGPTWLLSATCQWSVRCANSGTCSAVQCYAMAGGGWQLESSSSRRPVNLRRYPTVVSDKRNYIHPSVDYRPPTRPDLENHRLRHISTPTGLCCKVETYCIKQVHSSPTEGK